MVVTPAAADVEPDLGGISFEHHAGVIIEVPDQGQVEGQVLFHPIGFCQFIDGFQVLQGIQALGILHPGFQGIQQVTAALEIEQIPEQVLQFLGDEPFCRFF